MAIKTSQGELTWNHKIEPLVWQVSPDIEKSIYEEKLEMKKIYSDEQIVGFVREAERSEATIAEFCWQKGFNESTFYKWKKTFWVNAGRWSQATARTRIGKRKA